MRPMQEFVLPGDLVLDVCDACGGDGGFDDTYIGRSHEVRSDWSTCDHCEGTGFVLIDAEPIEMDDLVATGPTTAEQP